MVSPISSLLSFGSSGPIATQRAPRARCRALRTLVLLGTLLALTSVAGRAVTHSTTKKASSRTHKTVHRYAPLPSGFHWRISRWNPMFPGSHELLVQQNQELDRTQSFRVTNEIDLIQHELSQELVPVNETEALKISGDLVDNRRYCRPWTRDFLQDFSQAYYEQFHSPLQVNSLVRTMEQQHRLRRHNHFAAPEWGDTASTHLAGVAFDLSRRGLTPEQYAWITSYLLPLKEAGVVDPIEERQPVLHVVVFDKYGDHSGGASDWSEANEPTEMDAFGIGGSQP
jgi:Family of unknown function (DUF5715)